MHRRPFFKGKLGLQSGSPLGLCPAQVRPIAQCTQSAVQRVSSCVWSPKSVRPGTGKLSNCLATLGWQGAIPRVAEDVSLRAKHAIGLKRSSRQASYTPSSSVVLPCHPWVSIRV